MDPTIALIKIKNPEQFHIEEIDYPTFWSSDDNELNISIEEETNSSSYFNKDLLEKVENYHSFYIDPKYQSIRNKINLFYPYPNNSFFNQEALKLINIDSLYNVSRYISTPMQPKQFGDLRFCDIYGGPGSQINYLLWRHPDSIGYGMTLRPTRIDKNDGEPYDFKDFPYQNNRLRIFNGYGENRNGDIKNFWKQYIEFIHEIEPRGIHLCIANQEIAKEILCQKSNFIYELLIALHVLEENGNFVCKLFDTHDNTIIKLLYICGISFKKIALIKPLTSDENTLERYIVCLEKKSNIIVQKNIHILQNSLEKVKIPISFATWITEQNNILLEKQIELAETILSYIQSQNTINISDSYYLPKLYILWKIPTKKYKNYTFPSL